MQLITDWVSFVPKNNFSGSWRRVGNNMEVVLQSTFFAKPKTLSLNLEVPVPYDNYTKRLNEPKITLRHVPAAVFLRTQTPEYWVVETRCVYSVEGWKN